MENYKIIGLTLISVVIIYIVFQNLKPKVLEGMTSEEENKNRVDKFKLKLNNFHKNLGGWGGMLMAGAMIKDMSGNDLGTKQLIKGAISDLYDIDASMGITLITQYVIDASGNFNFDFFNPNTELNKSIKSLKENMETLKFFYDSVDGL